MQKRTLILLRHAEAEPLRSFTQQDVARELTEKGRADLARLAVSPLKNCIDANTQFFVSPSQRTRSTMALLAEALFLEQPKITWCERFYDGSRQQIFEDLQRADDSCLSLVAVGHNPVWSDVVSLWCGADYQLSPGNAAVMVIDADSWASCASEEARWRLEAIY